MTEKGYIQNGCESLCYICSYPTVGMKDVGVLFVHARGGNKLGPHRMFVELEQKLNTIGFPTLRFDLAGCGDSTGDISKLGTDSEIKDILAVVDFFVSERGLNKVILLGISRGARMCFSTLAKNTFQAAGAVIISAPTSSALSATKSFSTRLKEYVLKFLDPYFLLKMLKGKVHFGQVIRTLAASFNSFGLYRRDYLGGFCTKCPLLFIYGQNDPIAKESQRYYSNFCQRYEVPHRIVEIQNANHSFFHYKWKEQIFKMVENWLMENINSEVQNR